MPTSSFIPVEGVVLGQNDGITQDNSGLQSSRDLAGPQADLRSMGSMCLGADQPSVDCRSSSSSTNDPFGSSQRANELFRFVESLYSKLEYATIDGAQALVDLSKSMSDSPVCQRHLSTAFLSLGKGWKVGDLAICKSLSDPKLPIQFRDCRFHLVNIVNLGNNYYASKVRVRKIYEPADRKHGLWVHEARLRSLVPLSQAINYH